jgi:hypothetical protein
MVTCKAFLVKDIALNSSTISQSSLLAFNTETIRPMSIKIKVSLPLGIEEKQQILG